MTQAFSSISYTFNINDAAFKATPVATSISNEFDYIGSLLGLKRLPEERNDSYKRRLLDVFVDRANSTYTGLVNGITRELALEFFHPLTISLRSDIDPSWSPRIEFKDGIVYVWQDISTRALEMTINRSDRGRPEYHLSGLTDLINTSAVFTAELDTTYQDQRSDTIVNSSSTRTIINQQLISSRFNHLGVSNIERGSISINNNKVFRLEVASLEDVDAPGKYFVDYTSGLITSFSTPSDDLSIQYNFIQTPFVTRASPVIIRAINSPEFQQVMFNQVVLQDGSLANGTATIKGAEIINELMSVTGMFWGE